MGILLLIVAVGFVVGVVIGSVCVCAADCVGELVPECRVYLFAMFCAGFVVVVCFVDDVTDPGRHRRPCPMNKS